MYRKTISLWRYPLTLLALFGLLWIALAIAPVYRQDWLLENLIVVIAVPLFVLTARRLRFSNFTYTCIYELIEWAAALVFGGDLGQAYLGMQGDIWDGQKDMALALAGTTIMLVALAGAGRLPVRRA